ncbi:MAG: hypothetical protein V3T24_01275 [Longimicrobiales bacterium]
MSPRALGAFVLCAAGILCTVGAPAHGADEAKPARLLVVTVANGYRHESIPVLSAVIERLGVESGLYVGDRAATNEQLQAKTTPAALKRYDGVVFANTSKDVPLADRDAFLA